MSCTTSPLYQVLPLVSSSLRYPALQDRVHVAVSGGDSSAHGSLHIVRPLPDVRALLRALGLDSKSPDRRESVSLFLNDSLYEPIRFNTGYKLAYVTLIVYYTAFYSFLFPLGVAITVLALVVHYWVDKYLFIYKYKCPIATGAELTTFFARVALLAFFAYLVPGLM
jgi:hypothetical protein